MLHHLLHVLRSLWSWHAVYGGRFNLFVLRSNSNLPYFLLLTSTTVCELSDPWEVGIKERFALTPDELIVVTYHMCMLLIRYIHYPCVMSEILFNNQVIGLPRYMTRPVLISPNTHREKCGSTLSSWLTKVITTSTRWLNSQNSTKPTLVNPTAWKRQWKS